MNRALSGQRSARAEAWRHIDHSRTGLVGLEAITSSWTRRACSDAYAKRVLAAPVIFVEALDFERPDVSFSFEHWITNPYKGVRPTFKDLETHLSLFFPEVRARGFAELRSMDCPSRVWQTVPALFYTALLYANDALEACVQRLLPYVSQLPALLEESGRKALELPVIRKEAEWLMRLAMDSATSLPGCFHGEQSRAVLSAYAERFTMAGRSPADEVIEIAMRHGGKFLPSHCLQLEAEWARMLE